MNIDSSNIVEELDGVLEAIKKASFIGLDLELTGINNTSEPIKVEQLVSEVYRRMCGTANLYNIIQFGICCVEEINHEQSEKQYSANYTYRAYDFSLFPRPLQFADGSMFSFSIPRNLVSVKETDLMHDTSDDSAVCMNSFGGKEEFRRVCDLGMCSLGIDFNLKHLDLGAWIQKGMNYCCRHDFLKVKRWFENEKNRLEILVQKLESQLEHEENCPKATKLEITSETFDGPDVPEAVKAALLVNAEKIQRLLERDSTGPAGEDSIHQIKSLDESSINALKRKLEDISSDPHLFFEYNEGLMSWQPRPVNICKMSFRERIARVKSTLAMLKKAEIKLVGFNIVWEEIVASRKPIIVHNGLYDVLFSFSSFHNILDGNCLNHFKWVKNRLLPAVYDTKYLGFALVDKINCYGRWSLQQLNWKLEEWMKASDTNVITYTCDYETTDPYHGTNKRFHTASYDAFIAAKLFAQIKCVCFRNSIDISEFSNRFVIQQSLQYMNCAWDKDAADFGKDALLIAPGCFGFLLTGLKRDIGNSDLDRLLQNDRKNPFITYAWVDDESLHILSMKPDDISGTNEMNVLSALSSGAERGFFKRFISLRDLYNYH